MIESVAGFTVAKIIAVTFIGIALGLFYKGLDRRIAARMQARIGPPVSQPFRDIKKLMMKENIVPKYAVRWIFNLMPFVSLVTTILILLYLPMAGLSPVLEGSGDLILILYMLIFPSLAMVMGGFSSGSPYATVGAQREMVTMISYEFPLAITIVSIASLLYAANPAIVVFSLSAISQNLVWSLVGPAGTLGLGLLFVVMLWVMPGELGAIPFDSAEAETELAGGALVEYSGRNLALFYLSHAVKLIVIGSLVIALFIPFGISNFLGMQGLQGMFADAGFYLLKLFLVIFAGSTFIRVAVARFRITQIVKTYWGYSTIIALIGMALIWIDMLVRLI